MNELADKNIYIQRSKWITFRIIWWIAREKNKLLLLGGFWNSERCKKWKIINKSELARQIGLSRTSVENKSKKINYNKFSEDEEKN